MTRLPMPEALVVEQRKVTDYLLDVNHQEGGAKARFFIARGFDQAQWSELAVALRRHGATQTIVKERTTAFGMKYVVECNIETPDGRNPCIRSVWIADGSAPPRLTTAYPHL